MRIGGGRWIRRDADLAIALIRRFGSQAVGESRPVQFLIDLNEDTDNALLLRIECFRASRTAKL